ncbi:MAG: NmrA family NAD(P)-binding protein [Panacibacter sp.]
MQLLGVAHPGPGKKEQFITIDLASVNASADAAKEAGVTHFIYVSVAQIRTSIMHDYQQCRALGEAAIRDTQIPATFIRPWYVIGPGHYWPLLFQPVFKIMEWLPPTANKAKALRLVTLKQMLNTLLYAVELEPFAGTNIIEIDTIRRM